MGVDVIISDEENVSVTEREGKFLYTLAKKCKGSGVIVEIGSWKGRSTIYLAKGSKAGNSVRVYAIDPHTGSSEHKEKFGEVWTFDEFVKNIKSAGVDDIVTPIVKTSEEAAKEFDRPVELIFIDGAHEYEFVKKRFRNVVSEGCRRWYNGISRYWLAQSRFSWSKKSCKGFCLFL